jgi:hypothetical protein
VTERVCARCTVAPVRSRHGLCKFCEPCFLAVRTERRRLKHAKAVASRPVKLCLTCQERPRYSEDVRCKYCETCNLERTRSNCRKSMLKRYNSDPEFRARNNAAARECLRKQREQDPEASRQRSRDWRATQPKEKLRAIERRSRYGITDAQYSAMLLTQNGACEICLKAFVETPHVDHCHATGVVRGLLCRVCNLNAGVLEKMERENTLVQTADYLLKHREAARGVAA